MPMSIGPKGGILAGALTVASGGWLIGVLLVDVLVKGAENVLAIVSIGPNMVAAAVLPGSRSTQQR